jgi:hypothetical protein
MPADDADEMPVGRDQAEQIVGIAVHEQRNGKLARRINV